MKHLIGLVVFSLFLSFSSVLYAAEYDRNPDRFPSIGLTLGLASLSGDADLTFGTASASQDLESTDFDITIDARIPVSQSVTFTGAFGWINSTVEVDETSILAGQDIDGSGIGLRIGLRYYFNGK